MRRRLLTTYLTLLAAVSIGLAAPLGANIAARDTQTVFIDRQNDAVRFAGLAEQAIRTDRTVNLHAELTAYDNLYGISSAVVNRDGQILITSRPGIRMDDPAIADRLRAALAGERRGNDVVLWPWQRVPLVVAEPVGLGGEIIGAVVTISPVDGIRAATLRWWGLLGLITLVVLIVGTLAARPLTRWTLRPVADLDEVTHAITEGEMTGRVPADAGPPELRRLAISFNTMADTIATLLERQRTFVSYASHQLRNPLAALRLRVDTLGEQLPEYAASEHALTLDEVDRLTRICDSLLALARAESSRTLPSLIDAAAIADDRVTAWQLVASRSGGHIVRTGAVHADVLLAPGTLDQALDALIDNGLKFASPRATITVDVQPPSDGLVHIHVVDDGPGLREEELREATLPFWRDTNHRNVDGSGLGLAIVNTLIVAGGGTLHLRPAEPHGIDAHLTLPVAGPP
jgi:signal transduction histidine kinase